MILRQFDKRILKRDSHMRLPTGRTIMLPRHSSNASEVFVTGANCDLGAEALFARFAEAERDMIDAGAHIGYYSLYLSPLVRHVYAFEPDARNLPSLIANADRGGNITAFAKAVSSRSGAVSFVSDGDSAVSRVGHGGDLVPAVSIDDFVRETGARPALIKIDVEGHDLAVIEGARTTIAAEQPLILTEFNLEPGAANDSDQLFRLICDVGYQAYAYIWRQDRTLFERVTLGTIGDPGLKMLFLVPPRLAFEFDKRITR